MKNVGETTMRTFSSLTGPACGAAFSGSARCDPALNFGDMRGEVRDLTKLSLLLSGSS